MITAFTPVSNGNRLRFGNFSRPSSPSTRQSQLRIARAATAASVSRRPAIRLREVGDDAFFSLHAAIGGYHMIRFLKIKGVRPFSTLPLNVSLQR